MTFHWIRVSFCECPRHNVGLDAWPIASKEERDLIESYHLGVNSYIQKPVDFDQFRKVVGQTGLYWMVVNHPAPLAAEEQG